MQEYTRRQNATLAMYSVAVLALTSLAACGEKKPDSAVVVADSALGRDLAMAARDSVVQPKLQDVPAPAPAPAPVPVAPIKRPTPKPTPKPAPKPAPVVTPSPAPTPAPVAAVSGTVAAGTTMSFASNSKVCSNTTQVGEKFTADLNAPVSATNGVDIPAGATGTFEVTEKKTAANSGDNTSLTVKLVSITFAGRTYPVDATVQTAATEKVRSASKTTDAKKVAGGAIIGGIIGQIIGKDTKGTVIGAAAGAAAGTVAAAKTADYDTCLQSGASVTVRLDSPATVRPALKN